VAILLELIDQHDIPEKIASDKETQFTSHEFRELCKSDDISHIPSSHIPPQRNERAERFVDNFKRAFLKL
jgi:transposase InsO family protein